jgi:multidrug efflux pump subunit AcrA (membrane-fusion protein)
VSCSVRLFIVKALPGRRRDLRFLGRPDVIWRAPALRDGYHPRVRDVTLPRLADALVEGTVSRWLKRPGDRVARGEPLVEIETDKVNSELESPYGGLLTEIVTPEGSTVPVGEVIARIEEEPSA